MSESQNFRLSDAEYHRLQQGDQRLQTKVFDKYAPPFVGLSVKKFGLPVEDAEEIVSSAFAKLFCKIAVGAVQPDNLEGYVYTIIRHKCFEKTEEKQRNILETTDFIPDIIEKDSDNEPDNDLMQTLNTAFNRLGEKCQKLLGGFYWDDKDHKEIAVEFGITEEASRQRKRECMKRLRLFLT